MDGDSTDSSRDIHPQAGVGLDGPGWGDNDDILVTLQLAVLVSVFMGAEVHPISLPQLPVRALSLRLLEEGFPEKFWSVRLDQSWLKATILMKPCGIFVK